MPTTQDIKDSIDCMDCVNAFFHCISAYFQPAFHVETQVTTFCALSGPKNQFNSYWREGMFDMCKTPMNEFMFCMKLKFAEQDEAKVRAS